MQIHSKPKFTIRFKCKSLFVTRQSIFVLLYFSERNAPVVVSLCIFGCYFNSTVINCDSIVKSLEFQERIALIATS